MANRNPSEPLPYWLINIPQSQWPASCPGFLRDISSRDKAMISIPESEFHRLSWPEVQELVSMYLSFDPEWEVGILLLRWLSFNPKRLIKSINSNAVLWIIAGIKSLCMGSRSGMDPLRILLGGNGLGGMISSRQELHLFRIQVCGTLLILKF